MHNIDWNSGMSLGVKALDDDHKRLLGTINELYRAIDANEEGIVLEEIFATLEEYVVQHFHREEALMRKCGFEDLDEHIQQHQNFAQHVPELKAKLLAAQDYITAQEVSIYLTDWLINHIIAEDLPLIGLFEEHGLTTQSKPEKKSWLKYTLKKVASGLGFEKRMLFAMLIPLVGMFISGLIILWNDYQKYDNMKKVLHVSHIVSDVNELLHTIQIERGLTSGYLTSIHDKFDKPLLQQRDNVDKGINIFLSELETVHKKQLDVILSSVNIFKKDISHLDELRQKVYDKQISKTEAIKFYTDLIENILSIASKMPFLDLDRELSSSISALSHMLRYKDALGLQRAYGTALIEEKNAVPKDYQMFLELIGTEKTLFREFNDIATQEKKNSYKHFMEFTSKEQIKAYIEQLTNQNVKGLDSGTWFEIMTKHIDQIKSFEDQFSYEINQLIHTRINKSVATFTLWLFYIGLIFIATLFVTYLFKQSSIEQIRQLTDAMSRLAHGDRSLRLAPLRNKDDIANMIDAYETSRQKLLKGDVFAQLYLNQKEIELEDRNRENVKLGKLAFIDPLTGMLNRRRFEELSNVEFERAHRYSHPLSFLMLDIDRFKDVNDTYGHAAGDEVLKHFSHICQENIRSLDLLARIGGEEFIIVLPETDDSSAHIFADRLREKISSSTAVTEHAQIKYTVSIGIALLEEKNDSNVNDIIKRADKALYQAKESGRNKVVLNITS